MEAEAVRVEDGRFFLLVEEVTVCVLLNELALVLLLLLRAVETEVDLLLPVIGEIIAVVEVERVVFELVEVADDERVLVAVVVVLLVVR